ncbi:MAG: (2Fe-2S) ferredoxin domain-containing protein [Cyanobacteriota bacterium]|nr:(2Fe-2S) ferredoxin domain-containing protein [Cyanobacteriota bacterium]
MYSQRILVCQNRTCRKQGAKVVLAEFQAHNIDEIEIIGSGCLGQCGNGPMVLILPGKILYDRVFPDRVGAILARSFEKEKIRNSEFGVGTSY